MSETPAEKTCTPCRGGIPPLTRDEAQRFQAQAPNWELGDNAHRIERTFRFRNFREALAFVQEVGELAETEGHHPDISFGWGYVTVSLSTKKIKGLHENDFIMASKIDRVHDRSGRPLDRQWSESDAWYRRIKQFAAKCAHFRRTQAFEFYH